MPLANARAVQIAAFGDSHLAALKFGEDLDPSIVPGHIRVSYFQLGPGLHEDEPYFKLDRAAARLVTTGSTWRNRLFPLMETTDPSIAVVHAAFLGVNPARLIIRFSRGSHLPWQHATDGIEPVSGTLVDRIIGDDMRNDLAFLRALHEGLGLTVVVVVPPQVWDLADGFSGKQPAALRSVVQRYYDIVIPRVEEIGIPVLRQPPETLTEHGFTDAMYRTERPQDGRHANARYGTVVLHQLISWVEAQRYA